MSRPDSLQRAAEPNQPQRKSAEPEYVTNWPATYGAVALGLLLAGAVVTAFVVEALKSPPPLVQQPVEPSPRKHRKFVQRKLTPPAVDAAPQPQAAPELAPWFMDSVESTPQPTAPRPQPQFVVAAHVGDMTAALPSIWLNSRLTMIDTGLLMLEDALTPPLEVDTAAAVPQPGREPFFAEGDQPLVEYMIREVPEIDLDFVEGTSKELFDFESDRESRRSDHSTRLEELSAERCDLTGLPLLAGGDCVSDPAAARERMMLATAARRSFTLGERSLDLRFIGERRSSREPEYPEYVTPLDVDLIYQRADSVISARLKRPVVVDGQLVKNEQGRYEYEPMPWKLPRQVAILEQLFQTERPMYRRFLLNSLSQIEGPEATHAIARRALFDTDSVVRSEACLALLKRQNRDGGYLPLLRQARQYPFEPVRANAHQALAFLDSRTRAPVRAPELNPGGSGDHLAHLFADTTAMLSKHSHVGSPKWNEENQQFVVKEMVKVNHLKNCLLCHPRSDDRADPLRGPIPTPGEQLPRVYYSSSRGNFVRADIVYLRQDFSMMLPVADHGKWPKMQRFDFFLRTRAATEDELAVADVRRELEDVQRRRWLIGAAKMQWSMRLGQFRAMIADQMAKLPSRRS